MEFNHYEYVKKYFELYYGTYYIRLGEKEVQSLCLEISKRVRNKYNSLKKVLNGKADDFIMSIINRYVNQEHPRLRADYINLRNYATQVVRNNHFVNYSEKTLDTIVEGMCSMLMPAYNYVRMNEGKMDEEILACYNVFLSDICFKIREYVTNYVLKNVEPIADVDNVAVENEIIKLIMNTDSINCFDLLLGRHDEKIREVAEKNREDNKAKRRAESPDTFKYIRGLIEVYSEDNIDSVNRNVSKVDIHLREQGLTPNEIVSGKYNVEIRKLYNEYRMKDMKFYVYNKSVKNDNAPDEYEPVKGKIDIDVVLKRLLLTATLVGLVSYAGYELGQEIRKDYFENEVDKFDTYSYDSISSIYSDRFELTADNIMKEFSRYSESGNKFGDDNYNYLPFYKAYRSVSDNKRLYVMDNMLSQIKEEVVNNEEQKDLYSAIRYNGCYLDFIYDRLESMGFEEIRENKYTELLSAYMKAAHDHRYSDPVKFLTGSQKTLLNKILKKYEEYSGQYLVEFGVLLNSEDETYATENLNGRGH